MNMFTRSGHRLATYAVSSALCLLLTVSSGYAALSASSSAPNSVTLTWTAPGDDGNSGTAAVYDVRYSTSNISDANWSTALQAAGEPAPKVAGTAESFTVNGLQPSTTYFFALKTSDEAGNWSVLSNVITKATTAETTPPAAITTLSAPSSTINSVTLQWTAVGDDGTSGTASTYDIRYSTSTITDANWGGATQVSGEPTPLAAGSTQSFVVSGLAGNTTYHFAIKVADEVPNWSLLSNVVSRATTNETTPPANIVNLNAASSTSSTVSLSWTAPGDDGNTGTASQYDVRYSTSTITAGNFASASQATGEPAPAAPGTGQSFIVTGLNSSTTYFFAIKTADEVPNWSGISNIASRTTTAEATPPASITTLTATNPTQNSVRLAWTAVGDDGSTGTAASYDIRYSTSAITDINWTSATQVTGEPAPKVAGSAETFTVGGLNVSTLYYFAIKVSDEVPNTSGLSNVANASTTADVTPPSGVGDLSALTGSSSGEILLGWTAPGDDNSVGIASSYDIRYSNDSLTVANWDLATSATAPPTPGQSGAPQSFVLRNLTPGAKYFAAVRAYDEQSNESPLSNLASAIARDGIATGHGEVVMISPEDGSVLPTCEPVFIVSNVDELSANVYEFEIATDSSFSGLVTSGFSIQEPGSQTGWEVDVRLESQTEYYWRARVNGGEYSNAASFTIVPQTRAYPNPFVLSQHSAVTFSELPAGSELYLTSVSGEPVRRWSDITSNQLTWNGTDELGSQLGSGVYLWYVVGSEMKGKVILVR